MKRALPPIIKIYEALGAIADQRIEILPHDTSHLSDTTVHAKVFSSSRGKVYDVIYDSSYNAIIMNDNGSYRGGYIGYPGIALLMILGKITLDNTMVTPFQGIQRKDLNTKNKNDFDLTKTQIDDLLSGAGVDMQLFYTYIAHVEKELKTLDLDMLGDKILPPKGY